MTGAQFDALAQLMRLRESPSREAMRLVLVNGLTHAAAAEQAGAIRTDVTRRISSARRVIELAQQLMLEEAQPQPHALPPGRA